MEKGISTRGKMNGKDKKNGWMKMGKWEVGNRRRHWEAE
jgi:hypothetical protein